MICPARITSSVSKNYLWLIKKNTSSVSKKFNYSHSNSYATSIFNENIINSSSNDYKNIVLYQHQTQDYERGQVFERDIGRQGYMQVYQEDSEIGVYHLNLGSDRGLVKKIEFKRKSCF